MDASMDYSAYIFSAYAFTGVMLLGIIAAAAWRYRRAVRRLQSLAPTGADAQRDPAPE